MQKKEKLVCALLLLGALLCMAALLLSLCRGRADGLTSLLLTTHRIWEKPFAFGGFHLSCLLLCVIFATFFGIFGARWGRGSYDRLVFLFGISFLWLELYKQLYSFLVLWNGRYDWGIFPFQFCSLPIYFCLIVPFLREGVIKETVYRFLALFGTMGGCLVMAYPRFYAEAALCIHSMLWHTLMICMGVFLLYARGYGRRWGREIGSASTVFLLSLTLATALNLGLTPVANDSPNPLNLFYMNPYQSTYFLVVKDVWAAWGWGAAMLCYVILFVFVGATAVFFAISLTRLVPLLWMRAKKDEKK